MSETTRPQYEGISPTHLASMCHHRDARIAALTAERNHYRDALDQWGQPCDDCGQWRPWTEMTNTFTPDTAFTAESNRWTCSDVESCEAHVGGGQDDA